MKVNYNEFGSIIENVNADITDASDRIGELSRIKIYSAFERAEIEILYRKVLKKKFVRTFCNDCYRDAVIEIFVFLHREKAR